MKEEDIKKALGWIENHIEEHISADGEFTVWYDEITTEFTKAMRSSESEPSSYYDLLKGLIGFDGSGK